MNAGALIGLAIVVFASTNIDDIFVLMMFFSDSEFSSGHVVLGQYIGIALLVGISLIGAFAALVIPAQWIGLMGLLPIALGVRKLLMLNKNRLSKDGQSPPKRVAPRPTLNFLVITAVTFSNGGDNVGVYMPLFASSTHGEIIILIAVFFVMVAVWCGVSYTLIRRTRIGDIIQRAGHILLPFILIALGFYILAKAFL